MLENICVPEPWIPVGQMKWPLLCLLSLRVTAEIKGRLLLAAEIDPRIFRDVIRATGSNSAQRVEEFFRRNERTGGTLSDIESDLRYQSLSVARESPVPLDDVSGRCDRGDGGST